MRNGPKLAGVLAALLLGACATMSDPRFGWSLHQDGSGASLVYGEYDTDNIGYGLECRHEGGLRLSDRTAEEWTLGRDSLPTVMRVRAGGLSLDLPATAAPDHEGYALVTADIDDPAAFLRALRKGGTMRTESHGGKGRAPVPARDMVTGFAAACGYAR